jgi:CheY-like chemotaxis protein
VILEAGNGKEAFEVLIRAERLPKLILLDVAMPILDGKGFLRMRAQDPIIMGIPVIAISGSPSLPLEGVEKILRKPVEFTQLLRLIEKYQ